MSGLEQVHKELEDLFEELRGLIYDVNMHNPGLANFGNPVSLATLAATMGTLGYRLNKLGVETLAVPEREQVEDS